MSLFRCNNCLATYSDVLPDGIVYYHICAPLGEHSPADKFASFQPRDENKQPFFGDRVYRIRAEGKGVTCLSDPKLKEPRWITEMKAQEAKMEASDDA
jgi:hypothetical protein